MASPSTTPANIGPTADGSALRIEWQDRHESIYRPRDLRMACPCAGCVDELTGRRILTEAMVEEGVYPTAIEYVGRYALQFFWSDGHNTGYYPYDFLRRLCDCSSCKPPRSPI